MPISLNETQLYEEYNTLSSFELCYQGQEQVQELIYKVTETVQILRHLAIYLLHGDHNSYLQRKIRLEELFNSFESFLKRLRLIGILLNQRKFDLENQKQPTSVEDLETLKKQKLDLETEVELKNRSIKFSIDQITDIIWNINSIQTIKQ